ncbi:MAG: LysM peptidoglycan-binding domain-containing protein [Candidatus Limnocylindrales bacterium]
MTDRGLPIVDGAPACPFVAFEDDRDARATSPDHRHRCYAEVTPAPRALAHQEAYCLASAFPVCPTFQDWARRESARALTGTSRSAVDSTGAGPAAGVASAGAAAFGGASRLEPQDLDELIEPMDRDAWAEPGTPIPGDPSASRRNPPRSWADPPPWLGGEPEEEDVSDVMPLPPVRGGGLAGSFADRLAGPPSGRAPAPAGPSQEAAPASRWAEPDDANDQDHAEAGAPAGPRPGRQGLREDRAPRDAGRREARRPVPGALGGPSWERPKRMEAYPTLKTRMGLPSISLPPVLVGIAAVILSAVVLFFLPALLGVGNPPTGANPSATPRSSAAASGASAAPPTAKPVPTQQIYVVQAGDTMSKIANRFSVTLQGLIDANVGNIPNPDLLEIGQEVIIPGVAPTTLPDAGSSPSPVTP